MAARFTERVLQPPVNRRKEFACRVPGRPCGGSPGTRCNTDGRQDFVALADALADVLAVALAEALADALAHGVGVVLP